MKSKSPKIAEIVLGLPIEGPFDYFIGKIWQKKIAVGMRVRIVFNRRVCTGFVIGIKQESIVKELNPILALLDKMPTLDELAMKLTKEISQYYGCSWGEAMETYLPTALRRHRICDVSFPENEFIELSSNNQNSLTGVGKEKLNKKKRAPGKNILLYDETGEKRWPFLLKKIQETFKNNQSVIFLVPEVAMIEKIIARLPQAVESCAPSGLAILDKRLSLSEELDHWINIKQQKRRFIIGTRSAVFAPTSSLGLMVVYDGENYAYKQEQSPHYDARQVAQMRLRIERCDIVWVATVPSVEMWHQSKQKDWEMVSYPSPWTNRLQIVDMTNYDSRRSSPLSFPLQNAILKYLEANGRIFMLMNRRGFTTRTACHQCGFTMKCHRCEVNLTYMYSKKALVCRHCHFTTALPKLCPSCQSSYLRSTGFGIEKLESELNRLYPQARIHRFDKDVKTLPEDFNILIGTEAILHQALPLKAQLVAFLNFDAQLNRFDFRGTYQAFALLIRLRQLAQEILFVQTRMSDHYCLQSVLTMDFDDFYRKELKLRRELKLQPFYHLVAIGLRGKKEDVVFEQSRILHERLIQDKSNQMVISDPHSDVIPKLRDKYRYTIIVRGKAIQSTLSFIKRTLKDFKKRKGTFVTVNVDPY